MLRHRFERKVLHERYNDLLTGIDNLNSQRLVGDRGGLEAFFKDITLFYQDNGAIFE